MATVNISLPNEMYKDAKKALPRRGYASLSELVRDSLRKILYPEITENGFTREFEDRVLEAEKQPDEPDVWETEEDVKNFFRKMRKELKLKRNKIHGQSQTLGRV